MNSYLIWGPDDDLKYKDKNFATVLYETLDKKLQSDVVLIEEDTGEEISRGYLLQRSIKLALMLQKLDITENDVIAVISPNTYRFSILALSTVFIGATLTPINFSSSKDDLRHYFNVSKPKMLFVSKNILDKIRDLKQEFNFIKYVVLLNSEDTQNGELIFDELLNKPSEKTHFEVSKNAGTFILYSSGTTGLPKGVQLTHDNMLNIMKCFYRQDCIDIKEDSVMLGIVPLSHILGLAFQFGLLLYGKRIIFAPKFKPDTFLQTVQNYKITHLVTVPPLLVFLAQSPLVDKYDLSSITHIFCGGAPLGKEMENIATKRLKVLIRQLYGLSECGAITLMPPNVGKVGSVGKVVPGHVAKIIDPETGIVLGPNNPGEILFKGPSVMQGYKDNEVETKKMIDDEGYLHTGDVGYFDEDGYLFIMDRIKDLIKYKGFQVPPAQLEDILKNHPAIRNAAVVAKPDERAGELPTAFIVKHPNISITEREIIDYVAEKVSLDKQLHGGVIFIDEIPVTNSGKILKKDLRKLFT